MSLIVIIEDDAQNARLASKLLRHSGHEVLLAEDGESGLMLVADENPDLILVDLGLPDMDGQTVVGQLRLQSSLKQTPIIAFTAWPQATAFEMAQAYGCDGVITKPLDTRAFPTRIDAFLQRTQTSTMHPGE